MAFWPTLALAAPNDDLYKAIITNDVAGVKSAIAAGADVNQPDANGNQPLSTAVWSPEVTTVLLDAKADPNKLDKNGMLTGLFAAANWGEVPTIELLKKAGANPNVKNKDGYTALHYAAFNSASLPTIQALVDMGADPKAKTNAGLTPFMLVLKEARNPADKVKQLNGLTPFIAKLGIAMPDRVAHPTEAQFTNPAEIVAWFIDKGQDPNEKITFALSPLDIGMIAAENGKNFTGTSAAKAYGKVLDKMAKTKVVTYPILLAAEKGKIDAMIVLVDKGADLNVRSLTKSTPFWYAAYSGNLAAYKLIAEKAKPDYDETDSVGVTALMAAAMGGNGEIAADLLAHGAKIDATDMMNATALHYAAAYNRPDVVKVLLEHHANVDIAKKNLEAMKTESDVGIAPYGFESMSRTVSTYKQTTPLGIAKVDQAAGKGDYSEVIRLLEAAGAVRVK